MREIYAASALDVVAGPLMAPALGVKPFGVGVWCDLEEQIVGVGGRVLGKPTWIEPEAGQDRRVEAAGGVRGDRIVAAAVVETVELEGEATFAGVDDWSLPSPGIGGLSRPHRTQHPHRRSRMMPPCPGNRAFERYSRDGGRR
jgi:hypothetical protein